MSVVTVSSKYQIVIPKDVREGLKLKPGARLHAIVCDGRIELVPVVPIRRMRGFLKGLDRRAARPRPDVNVVDSSGWLEYFAGGPNAGFFAPALEATAQLIVPSIALFEVFKRVCQQRGRDDALQAIALMEQAQVVDLDRRTALAAATLSLTHRLPMADSIILATANAFEAVLWTQDGDFAAIPGVQYVARVTSQNPP